MPQRAHRGAVRCGMRRYELVTVVTNGHRIEGRRALILAFFGKILAFFGNKRQFCSFSLVSQMVAPPPARAREKFTLASGLGGTGRCFASVQCTLQELNALNVVGSGRPAQPGCLLISADRHATTDSPHSPSESPKFRRVTGVRGTFERVLARPPTASTHPVRCEHVAEGPRPRPSGHAPHAKPKRAKTSCPPPSRPNHHVPIAIFRPFTHARGRLPVCAGHHKTHTLEQK